MSRHIKEFVRSCEFCQKRKSTKNKAAGELRLFSSPVPFHTVGIDIFGPLPKTAWGNRYITVMVDRFTRWVELVAVPNITAATMAEVFIENIVLRHGCPKRLLSDRGSQFTSALLERISLRLGFKKIFTTAYHPQTNGQVERMNQYVAAALSAYVQANQTDWDEYLESIAFAYRTSIIDAIGNTPFYLVHGRDSRLPTQVIDGPESAIREDVMQYGIDLTKKIREAFQSARERQERVDEMRKRYYDSKHRPVEFAIGSLILVHSAHRRPGLSPKLAPRFEGPYRVLEKKSDVVYSVSHVELGKKSSPFTSKE